MKFIILRFAISCAIIGALAYSWTTIAALIGVPGFLPFAKLLSLGYGFYGYSISWLGVLVGGFYGFLEGFIWGGLFAWVYNRLML